MQSSLQRIQGNLLFVQGDWQLPPVLITAICQGQTMDALIQVALFAPHNVNVDDLTELAEMTAQCSARQCTWWINRHRLLQQQREDVQRGAGIELIVHDGQERAQEQARVPLIQWPHPQSIPTGSDPDIIYIDSEDDQTFTPTNTNGNNAHSTLQQAWVPYSSSHDEGTFSPTNTSIDLGEEVTRPPNGSALSSLDEEMLLIQLLPERTVPDHEDIDEEVCLMAINMARQAEDQQGPLLEDAQIARNIDSPTDEISDMEQEYDDQDEPFEEDDPHEPALRNEPEPPYYASIVYMINSPPIRAHLPYGNRNRFYVEAAEALRVPLGQLVYLYAIPHPPEDIAQAKTTAMIAQLTGEVPPGSIHRYVLIDVEFHAELPSFMPEVDRSTRLIPKQLTRFQILRIMGVASYCIRARHEPQQCLLWINHRLISEDDRALQEFRHGDYIKIALPPDSKTAEHYTTREMAQICWTGKDVLAEFGPEARQYMPVNLPEVPPEASTIYALPPAIIQIEDEDELSMLQRTDGQLDSASDSTNGKVLKDITNVRATEITCPSGKKRHRSQQAHNGPQEQPKANRLPSIEEMPLFEQGLHRISRSIHQSRRALSSGDFMVHTWYIDHVRHRRQHWGRLVVLGSDATQWRRLILEAWNDLSLPNEPAYFHVVMPGPLNDFDGAEAHVLVTQSPEPGVATVLITLEFPDPAIGLRQRLAVAHSRVTTRDDVHEAADCHDLQIDMYTCQQVYQGLIPLDPNRIYPVQDGDYFIVKVLKPPRRPAQSVEAAPTVSDTLSFDLDPLPSSEDSDPDDRNGDPDTPADDHGLLQLRSGQPARHGDGSEQTNIPTVDRTNKKEKRVTLCLDAIVRPPVYRPQWRENEAAVQLFEQSSWFDTISKGPDLQPAQLPEGLRVPTSTYKEMVYQEPFNWQLPLVQELYVDGSTTTTHAAWSVVSVFHNGHQRTFQGCFYGKVETNPSSPSWIGATTTDNIAGELSAMTMAQAIALRQPHTSTCIRPDLRLSRLLATSQCTCKSNPVLARLVQTFGQWTANYVPVLEVRGHQDDAWNDLADAIAKYAASNEIEALVPGLEAVHQLASSVDDHKWAWLQDEPQIQQAFPPIFEGTVMQFPPSKRRLDQPLPSPGQQTQPWKLQCTMLTANVLALETPKQQRLGGRLGGHRTVRLATRWNIDGIAVAGIQEARTAQGKVNTDHYVILSSGCLSPELPHYGCELWLHRNIPFMVKDQQKLFLTQGRITVQHADPRRLLVTVELAQIHFGFLVLHAPCQKTSSGGQNTREDVSQWWETTANLLRKIPTSTLLTIFVDANAPLGTKVTSHYGSHGAEPSTEAGTIFEDFLDEFKLTVPATFSHWHQGPTTTWTHSGGHKSRKDYVLISDSMVPFVQSSQVVQHHDGIFGHEDHLPCKVNFQGWVQLAAPEASLKWDPEAFLHPERLQGFQQALESLPIPTWEVNIDDHCRVFEQQVLQLGQQFFAPRTKQRPRPKLTLITLEMIRTKRQFLDYGRRTGEIQYDDFKEALRDFEKMVKQSVSKDISLFYDDLMDHLEEAGCLANSKVVYNILTRLGAKKAKRPPIRPLPLLKDHEGNPVRDFKAQQNLWLQQFARQEAGTVMSYDALKRMNRAGVSAQPQDIELETFPDQWTIQSLLKKTKPGKVPGPDQMPSDLIRVGSRPLSMHLLALYTKSIAHMREPLAWKGGKLHPLWKGKKEPSDITGYRSIFISNYAGKLFHQLVRQPLVQQWELSIDALQMGGRQQHGADMAHHFLQLHQSWTKSKAIPSGALFIDVQAAFYTLLRQSIVECEDEGHAVAYAMDKAGVSPESIQQVILDAAKSPVTAELSRHLQAIVKDLLCNTFFTLEGLDLCCRTSRGTRPGDPVADLLYNMVMTTILIDFRTLAMDSLEDSQTEWRGSPEICRDFSQSRDLPRSALFDVTFVDDTVVMFHTTDNQKLVDIVQCLVSSMDKAMTKKGLSISLDPGKTEAILNIRGRGARAFKQCDSVKEGKLRWHMDSRSYELNLVHNYRHLGTNVQQGLTHSKEVSFRGSGAKRQFGMLSRSFFQKSRISLANKSKVFRTLCMSRLLYNVHVWAGVTAKEWEKWANMIRGPAALLMKGRFPHDLRFSFNLDTLCPAIGVLPPQDALHAARLAYLKRLTKTCPRLLWNLIFLERTWIETCQESFSWFCFHYPHKFPNSPQDDVVSWMTSIALDDSWKGRVRAASAACLSYKKAAAEQLLAEKTFRHSFDIIADRPPEPSSSPPSTHWICDQCEATFSTSRGLAMHSSKMHGYKTITRFYSAGDVCQHCLMWFRGRKRLRVHLHQQPDCLDSHRACFPPLSDDAVEELDNMDRLLAQSLKQDGWLPVKALQPALQLQGPSLPPAGSPEAALMLEKQMLQRGPGSEAFLQLQGRRFEADEADHDDAVAPGSSSDIPAFVLQSAAGTLQGDGRLSDTGLAREYAMLHIKHYVFVHFFSGYRRKEDLHAVLDEHQLPAGARLFTISVDLCLQRRSGDLARPEALPWWQQRVRSGQILGFGGGPPCETFSAARFLEGGPRPLRSLECPAGLPALKQSEYKQLHIGTCLVNFLFSLMLTGAHAGCCGFYEHPQFPTWALRHRPASIWSSLQARMLKSLACVSVISFDQCVFGSLGRKPTTFLLLRMSAVRAEILRTGHCGRCSHGPAGHPKLQGTMEDGTFRTAFAKIYPPALNALIARGVITHACSLLDGGDSRDFFPLELRHLRADFEARDDVQPDYHGGLPIWFLFNAGQLSPCVQCKTKRRTCAAAWMSKKYTE